MWLCMCLHYVNLHTVDTYRVQSVYAVCGSQDNRDQSVEVVTIITCSLQHVEQLGRTR